MDKEIGDSRTLLSVLQDFSGKHSALQYTTFLGSAAFDSYDTYRALLLLHQGVLYHQHSPRRAIYGGGQAQPKGCGGTGRTVFRRRRTAGGQRAAGGAGVRAVAAARPDAGGPAVPELGRTALAYVGRGLGIGVSFDRHDGRFAQSGIAAGKHSAGGFNCNRAGENRKNCGWAMKKTAYLVVF